MDSVHVYCFSYNNPERFARMNERFNTAGFPIHWVDPVLSTDSRVAGVSEPRVHAIMYNHIDMIRQFLASSASWGVFCEDDIYIRKDFAKTLRQAIDGYVRLDLDVLLLGYLIPYLPATTNIHSYHGVMEPTLNFLTYGNDLWGSQMYLLNRNAAQKILDTYGDHTRVEGPFSPDWTITKFGTRAALYPMLAVEEGIVCTDHVGQRQFHTQCTAANYHADLHM